MSNLQTYYPFNPQSGPTYMKQVINPRHQMPQDNQMQILELSCRTP